MKAIMLTDKDKLTNLTREFEKLLWFLSDKHPKVYEEYKSHLRPTDNGQCDKEEEI